MTTPDPAIEANTRGNAARDAGDLAAAEAAHKEAVAIAPNYEDPWFNLAVIYKWQCRWAEAREAVERSLALKPDDNPGSVWNLGIIATAQGDWVTARAAWKRYGIDVPDGQGPLEMNLGMTPVRVNGTEVVWCRRVDPARAIIASIPMPDSGRHHGDLVLHDGEPKGQRIADGRQYSVFNELAVLAASDEATFQASMSVPSPDDLAELEGLADKAGLSFEDWTSSLELICKACSEGTPHEHRPGPTGTAWATERRCAFAARDETAVRDVLRKWAKGQRPLARLFSARKCERVERVL